MDGSFRIDCNPLAIENLRKFHTERRDRNVTVTLEKSHIPMLWLDTSVVIDLAKIQNKESVEKTRAARLSMLRETVRRAVRAERLICPEWDQSLEFEGKRLESQIREVVSDLSCGARCVPYAGIKDQQINRGLRAYLDLAETIHVPADIHFYGDPVQSVREAKQRHYIVEVDMPKPAEWLAKAKNDKQATEGAWEGLRQTYVNKKQTFDRQLALERVGESDTMIAMIGDFEKNTAAGKVDFWGYMGVLGFYQREALWRQMGGTGPGIPALYSFMRSPYYWELPIVDVACRLGTDLMIKHFRVKSGDHHDVQHLATAIPVAHFVVADKAMVDRCERLGIGAKWGTKLFSTRTIDQLCRELEALPGVV